MVKHTFEDFLKSSEAYARAEAHWRKLWDEVLLAAGQAPGWVSPKFIWRTPWLKTTFADGTPMMEGDPIFSAIRADGRVGVRVVQYPPRQDSVDLHPAIAAFDPGRTNVKVLEIFCALSEEAEAEVREIIRVFIETGELAYGRTKFEVAPGFPVQFEDRLHVAQRSQRHPVPA